ncbi:MAG: hypothetical protein ACK501_09270 [Planctomycetota bacterium]|jgi:hypothetical protein
MAPASSHDPGDAPPPFGSWPRTYAMTMVLAVVVILLLWLLTAYGNTPLGSAR